MNWIQRHSILVLIRQPTATIKHMRPPSIAANLFDYHLKQLVKAGYIARSGRGLYKLTPSGHKLAGTFSTFTGSQVENIKTVIMVTSTRADGKKLLFRWSRQPYLNRVMLPHDRIIAGKSLQTAVGDALHDKCGLPPDTSVQYIKSGLITITHENIVISHMCALIYAVKPDLLKLPFISRNGEAFWGSIASLSTLERLEQFDKLLQLIDAATLEPFELTLTY